MNALETKEKMHKKIKKVIDGQKVEGEITHRSASDINVVITKPYQDVSSGLHIPIFARPFRSFDTELGDKIAKDLLESIYHLCAFVFENMDSLTHDYLEFKKRIGFLEAKHVSEFVFKSRRLQLRKLLKIGTIDNIEYQKRLILSRKEHQKVEFKKNLILKIFFEELFPMIVPADTREDVLRILEKNIHAKRKNIKI